MKRVVGSSLVLLVLPLLCGAVTIGQIDTFQNGTMNGWFAGGGPSGSTPLVPPQVIANGGPGGAGDQYMKITAGGGNGPGSRLAVLNGSQWAGNYSGISGISMDLINLGQNDLLIRLLFEDPNMGPPQNEAVSTVAFALPVGSGWMHAFFPTDPASFTAVFGSAATVLSNATVIRIMHSSIAGDPTPIAGVVGVDNIAAVPEPGSLVLLGGGLLAAGIMRVRRRQ